MVPSAVASSLENNFPLEKYSSLRIIFWFSSFSEILENKTMSHRYPDERKSPRVHSYRLGNKVYPRGGTEQEKEAFILDNKSLFEL